MNKDNMTAIDNHNKRIVILFFRFLKIKRYTHTIRHAAVFNIVKL